MPGEDAIDYPLLEDHLRALAHASRLELLHQLRLPRALNELRVAPGRSRAGTSAARPVARQSVQAHLDKLVEIGAVLAQEPQERGRRGKEYVVNAQRMYEITEEFRRVTAVTLGGPVSREATIEAAPTRRAPTETGPRLVLVHGLMEGKSFPLRRSDLDGKRGWVLGRKPGLPVSLEYDPFVSLVNSEIALDRDNYALSDLGSSKNGTWLNWQRLGDAPAPLAQGDVIGVGRSLLVFRRA
ncbi:MAG TPA: FHA domain-containing protein [Candidatus Thermoplasmatota archaeon]|jgi:hypothetical protein|nr:FHA domain-containing protein [Candidatus Thermoplasmatota archaeon]